MHYPAGVSRSYRGLSLVELLVVIAIIGVLMAVLLPAVQSARASANNSACLNNLRQIGLALQLYESAYKKYPSVGQHADLLPYLEQSQRLGRIQQVDVPPPVLLCPSENRRDPIQFGNAPQYTLGSNYAFSRGRWIVDTHDETPFSGRYRADQVKDGLSNTLALAEVKLSTPLLTQFTGLTPRPPTDPATFENAAGTRYFLSSDGVNRSHTRWRDQAIEQVGFTTTFPPGTAVTYTVDDTVFDINVLGINGMFAAITARSHHGPWANVVFLDARVRSMSGAIRAAEWQALSTPSGQEAMDSLP
jgi:prepilin-type N-terminal cleavage/methylation domain-containing protein